MNRKGASGEKRAAPVGILVVSQGNLAREMVRSVEIVAGPQAALKAVCIKANEGPDQIAKQIRSAVETLDQGSGVLVLTDMLGNTPTNVSLGLASTLHLEVLAGCNMPILIKLLSSPSRAPIKEIARFVRDYGAEHIFWATEHPVRVARRRVRGR